MPQIIVLKPFKFAHRGVEVEEFEPDSKPRETSDECAEIAIREGWAKPAKAGKAEKTQPTREALDHALAELPGNQNDPDYVVNAMRKHFGDLFTEADEARVRDLVKKPD